MTLNTRLYLSAAERGPVLAVASLSGIKANAAGYNDFLRLNSYVDAFKNWFPKKVRGKDAVARVNAGGREDPQRKRGARVSNSDRRSLRHCARLCHAPAFLCCCDFEYKKG